MSARSCAAVSGVTVVGTALLLSIGCPSSSWISSKRFSTSSISSRLVTSGLATPCRRCPLISGIPRLQLKSGISRTLLTHSFNEINEEVHCSFKLIIPHKLSRFTKFCPDVVGFVFPGPPKGGHGGLRATCSPTFSLFARSRFLRRHPGLVQRLRDLLAKSGDLLSLLQNSISATHFAFIRRCERPRLRPARAETA